MRARELGLLVLLGAIWGMSYVFIRVASPIMGPAVLMEVRFSVGGAVLLAYVVARGMLGPLATSLRTHWRVLAVGGLFFSALPTTLIGFAELRLSASLATVLNAATPFFAALGSAVWLSEGFPARRAGGLVLGFLGVAVAVGTEGLAPALTDVLAVSASLLAAACYGLFGVYLRRSHAPVTGVTFATGSQLLAAAFLIPPASVTYRPFGATPGVVVSALGLAIFSTAIAYLIYYYLIERAGPTQTSTVTFVSPVFGILGGIVLLGEPLGWGLVAGLGLIVAGIWLTSNAPGFFGLRAARVADR